MYQMDTLVEEFLEKSLLYIPTVGEHFSIEFLCEDRLHPFVPIIHVCSCKTKRYDVSAIIAKQV